MTDDDTITLFHAPQTRSAVVLTLLEELGAPYRLHVLDMKAGEQKEPAYLAINPMGKVPAIRHRGAIVTEQVAIVLYCADLYPQAGLTPLFQSPLRGPYLRWLVFYAACYEPALIDKAMRREAGTVTMSPYGSFDTMLGTLTHQLAAGPYLFGEAPTAADILWGNALSWGTMFGLVPKTPEIVAYVERIVNRPAALKVMASDAALVASTAEKAAN